MKTTSKKGYGHEIDEANFINTDENNYRGSPRQSRRQQIIERSVQDAHELMEQKFDQLEIINKPSKAQLRSSGRGAQPQGQRPMKQYTDSTNNSSVYKKSSHVLSEPYHNYDYH